MNDDTAAVALVRALLKDPTPHMMAWAASAIERLDRAGWALVPKVPTEAMTLAGDDAVVAGIQPAAILEKPWRSPAGRCWSAMLAARLRQATGKAEPAPTYDAQPPGLTVLAPKRD